MSSLYDLTEEAIRLNDALEAEGIDDETRMSAMATYLAGAPVGKVEAYAKLIRNIEAESEAYEAEEKRFRDKRKACENRVTWLKAGLKAFFEVTGQEFVKTPLFKVSLQANGGAAPVVIVGDVPTRFLRPGEPDKLAISQALNDGETLDFAYIGERGKSVRIR